MEQAQSDLIASVIIIAISAGATAFFTVPIVAWCFNWWVEAL